MSVRARDEWAQGRLALGDSVRAPRPRPAPQRLSSCYGEQMTASHDVTDETANPLREQAIKRLKAKSEFHYYLWVWLGVSLIVNAVWYFTGAPANYWPMWPMLGMGIGAFFMGLGAYGPANRGITEKRVEEEMARLAGK